MTTLSLEEATPKLAELLHQTSATHEPIMIAGENQLGVLMSEEYWRGMQETIFLMSIPGMTESIKESRAEPLDSCSKTLDW